MMIAARRDLAIVGDLRCGLKNVSNTNMMTAGAAHGAGIYTAPDLSTSLGYMKITGGAKRDGPDHTAKSYIDGDNMCCMAICEIIDTGSSIKKSGSIWVVPDDVHLTTRFLLVSPGLGGTWIRSYASGLDPPRLHIRCGTTICRRKPLGFPRSRMTARSGGLRTKG